MTITSEELYLFDEDRPSSITYEQHMKDLTQIG